MGRSYLHASSSRAQVLLEAQEETCQAPAPAEPCVVQTLGLGCLASPCKNHLNFILDPRVRSFCICLHKEANVLPGGGHGRRLGLPSARLPVWGWMRGQEVHLAETSCS